MERSVGELGSFKEVDWQDLKSNLTQGVRRVQSSEEVGLPSPSLYGEFLSGRWDLSLHLGNLIFRSDLKVKKLLFLFKFEGVT